MSMPIFVLAPSLAPALCGCVDRGSWQPTPQPLSLSHVVAEAVAGPAAWPAG